MYPEIVTLALCATATGLSYYFCKEAKKVRDLAVRAMDIALLQCEDAAAYNRGCENTLQATTAEAARLLNDLHSAAEVSLKAGQSAVELAGIKAGVAALNARVSEDHCTVAASHAATAAEHAGQSKAYSMTAYANAKDAKDHAETAMAHSLVSHGHSIDAAAHAAKTDEHASSVGALSKSIADIAAQTKVRLVHRTDYSTDGSNIGRR